VYVGTKQRGRVLVRGTIVIQGYSFFLRFNLLLIIVDLWSSLSSLPSSSSGGPLCLSWHLTVALPFPIQAWIAIQHQKNGEVGTFKVLL